MADIKLSPEIEKCSEDSELPISADGNPFGSRLYTNRYGAMVAVAVVEDEGGGQPARWPG